jgi:hypothetical protein
MGEYITLVDVEIFRYIEHGEIYISPPGDIGRYDAQRSRLSQPAWQNGSQVEGNAANRV